MKWIYRFENLFCGLMILAVTIVLFVNVVLRYVFNASTSWSEEFIRYGFIWITFIGGAICVRQGSHVNVDLLANYLNKTGQKVLFLITSVIALVFIVWLGKLGLDTTIFNFETGQKSPGLSIPIFYVYIAIPLGCLLMVIHYIELLINVLRGKDLRFHKDENLA